MPQLLGAQPNSGRRVTLQLTRLESERSWLNRLAPLTVRRQLQAREWVSGDFWILYYRGADAVSVALNISKRI